MQQLYVFFSASTSRWSVLQEHSTSLKNLSQTRWSRRSDASKALKNNFESVYNALENIALDGDQKAEVRRETSALMDYITKLANAFMTVL